MQNKIEIVECQVTLRNAIRYALLAADKEKSRYALQTVLIEYDTNGGIAVVGTDGRRIHYVRCDNAITENLNRQILLPLNVAKWIARLPKADRKKMTLIIDQNGAVLVSAWRGRKGAEIATKHGREDTGRYPNWRLLLEAYCDGQEGKITGKATALVELFQPDYVARIDIDGVDVRLGSIQTIKPQSFEIEGSTSIAVSPEFMADALSLPDTVVVQLNGPDNIVRVFGQNTVAGIMPVGN